ncbi:hypothetical protein SDRG_04581 [Saprolegnia diclina VS20]|uniref:Uncharacterized protein n=1 Tax=Saprolegnia diclina (strain VS20) TaxID=1156394 RepID=T0S609_SAPDV|nr:hypothetical protein SDRG_04581 [Saprolegnia diclina VS20]EQC38152.1 hypothetical protein SDRG_04581 [Saprolegnia diclina VS20]|eukprot:XP_008608479.1 hypothetical protein SDRG_04581 [Saprolegnia diclina VS20]
MEPYEVEPSTECIMSVEELYQHSDPATRGVIYKTKREGGVAVGGVLQPDDTAEPLDQLITPEELHAAIKTLHNNRACGPDNMPAEILKAVADLVAMPLAQLLNEATARDFLASLGYMNDTRSFHIVDIRGKWTTKYAVERSDEDKLQLHRVQDQHGVIHL